MSVVGDHRQPTSKAGSFSSLKIPSGTTTDMKIKCCGNCYDIYIIQRQCTKVAAFDRHLFCGFLSTGFKQGKYRSSYHNTCLARRNGRSVYV